MDERFCVTSCAHCGQRIEFPVEGVGMEVECPSCGVKVLLQEELPTASKPPEEITAADLRSALTGRVPRRRISIFYQVGLLLVALFMVLLPLVYLAVATLAGSGVYWYAVHGWVLFTSSLGVCM